MAASLCGFGFLFLLVQLIREARMHFSPALSNGMLLGAVAIGLCSGMRIHARPRLIGERQRAKQPGPEFGFAATVLLAAIPMLMAAWSASGLEGWRETLARRSLAPQPLLQIALFFPLFSGAVAAAWMAVRAILAMHDWHRQLLHQRLRIAHLWTAMVVTAALGGSVAMLVRDANRYWPVPAFCFVISAAIAGLHRKGGVETATPHQNRWPAEVRRSWIAASITIAIPLAMIASAIGRDLSHSAWSQPIALLIGGSLIGFFASRLAARLHVGVDFVPLAVPMAAFLLTFDPVSPIREMVAAGVLFAGFALLVQHVARASHSIGHSLSSVGAVGAFAFGVTSVAFSAIPAGAWSGGFRMFLIATCVCLAAILAWRERGSGAAKSATLTAAVLWLITGPFAARHALIPNMDSGRADNWIAEIQRRIVGEETGRLFPNDDALSLADLGGSLADLLIVSGGRLPGETSDAVRSGRLLRRLSRATTSGGRFVFEEPHDPALDDVFDRYSRRANPPFGPIYDLRIHGPRAEYQATIVGPDIEKWLAERGWPDGVTAEVSPFR